MTDDEGRRLAEAVRRACADAALAAWEDARAAGLCAEGAWEVALGAIRAVDLDRVDAQRRPDRPPASAPDDHSR